MKFNIGIIGLGYVGNAVFQKFRQYYSVFTYDIKANLSNSSYEELVKNCKIIFVCVPTPMNPDGSCNTDFVTKILSKLNFDTNAIVINKSTVPPGSTDKFNNKFKIFFSNFSKN